MIIELIEEIEFNKGPWYHITVDGIYIIGTGNKQGAEQLYKDILADPSLIEKKKNVLKSEEIPVPLPY